MPPRRPSPAARTTRIRALGVALLALVAITCRDGDPMGPGLPSRASIAVAPRVERAAAAAGPSFVSLRGVRGVLTPVGGGAPYTVDADFVGDTATLAFDVTFPGPSQRYTLALAAIDTAGDTLFRSMREVTATPGTSAAVHDTLRYAAPDSAVAFLLVGAPDTVVIGTDSMRIEVTGLDRREQPVSRVYVGWSSRDTTVARVVPVGPGSALVIGRDVDAPVWIVGRTFNGATDSLRLRVAIDVGAVVIASDTLRTTVGNTIAASASVLDRGGVVVDRQVAWSSLDTTVALVAPFASPGALPARGAIAPQQILVTGVRAGTARLVAAAGLEADTSVVVVDPIPAAPVRSVAVGGPRTVDALGIDVTFHATPLDSLGSVVAGATFTWSLETPGVGSIVAAGGDSAVVRAVGNGVTRVIAVTGNVSGATDLTVSQVATLLRLSPDALQLGLDGRAQLTPTLLDGNGWPMALKPGEVAWMVAGDTTVAAVDSTGEVHGRAFGASGVTATARGLRSGTVSVSVADANPLVLSFMRDSVTMTGDSALVSVFLSAAQRQQAVTVVLAEATGAIRFATDTLVFAPGTAREDVMVYGSFAGAAVVTATDLGKLYAPGSLVVTGPIPIKLTSPVPRPRR